MAMMAVSASQSVSSSASRNPVLSLVLVMASGMLTMFQPAARVVRCVPLARLSSSRFSCDIACSVRNVSIVSAGMGLLAFVSCCQVCVCVSQA